MSYEIIYNKQFVKLRRTGEVVPLLLAGSNNCFEIGSKGRDGRRVRDWTSIRFYNRKGKLSEKPEIILNNLDAELRRIIRRHQGDREATPTDIRNRFGYYASVAVGGRSCAGTSWGLYRSQFANGIKNALTVEELAVLGVNLYFYTGSDNGQPATVPLKTEREYFTELKKWREWQANGGSSFYISFRPYSTDMVLDRLRAAKRKPSREKTSVEQDHYFVLADGYKTLVRYTSRGYRYTEFGIIFKKFRTEKDAEKYRQQLLAKRCYKADIWRVERRNGSTVFQV